MNPDRENRAIPEENGAARWVTEPTVDSTRGGLERDFVLSEWGA
jgi:hypothetical protein